MAFVPERSSTPFTQTAEMERQGKTPFREKGSGTQTPLKSICEVQERIVKFVELMIDRGADRHNGGYGPRLPVKGAAFLAAFLFAPHDGRESNFSCQSSTGCKMGAPQMLAASMSKELRPTPMNCTAPCLRSHMRIAEETARSPARYAPNSDCSSYILETASRRG